ncbi:MAG: membrane protein insertase YidC [FCB group bacterium]|nr:membrane protein insertase YidC [FCB group bacterium]
MDRNTVLAFFLIALILIATPFYMNKVTPPPPKREITADSVATEPSRNKVKSAEPVEAQNYEPIISSRSVPVADSLMITMITVNTDLYTAVVSSKNGGSLISFQLNRYTMNDTEAVELITPRNSNNLLVSTLSIDGDPLVLDNNWQIASPPTEINVFRKPQSLTFSTTVFGGKEITKTLTFYPGSYKIDVETDLSVVEENLSAGTFQLSWSGGMPITEKNSKDDLFYFRGYVNQAGEIQNPKIPKKKELKSKMTGSTNWVAVRSKYFAAALIPQTPGMGAEISGMYQNKTVPLYNVSLILSASQDQITTLYIGPLEYKRIHGMNVDLEKIMTLGWSVIRPISRGILALLTYTHKWIPNYGVILILFAIAVKIVVYPLTKKSYQSTKKMQQVQPMLASLKEKYKGDPQKLNKATMNLYKEYGVNPLGGCLPVVLQMPLLIALFQVFRSTIELRGAPFVLWITDLSAPDTLMYIGGFPLNILPIVMAVTMLLQQMMMPTTQAAGQQKQMTYIMNLVMLFIFYRFPSGLNLYYTLFNVLTIVQQKYLTPTEETLVPVSSGKKPKKK